MPRLTQLFLATIALTLCSACTIYRLRGNPVVKDSSFVVHDVYFELQDDSDAEIDRLVQGCHDFLAGLYGIAHFAAGRRDEDRTGDVNDTSFDVSLHVWFESQRAYSSYDSHPKHLEFIETFRENWASVRVFDSVTNGR